MCACACRVEVASVQLCSFILASLLCLLSSLLQCQVRRYFKLKMPEKVEEVSGKRKSENPVYLTFLKRAREMEEERKNQQEDETRSKAPYANITENVFKRICKHLSFEEVPILGSVCWNWYKFSRGPGFFEHVDLVKLNLPPQESQDFLMNLPSCVKKLTIGNRTTRKCRQTISVPALYNTLLERLPALDVLIFQHAFLTKPDCEVIPQEGFMLNSKVPMAKQVKRYYMTVRYKEPTSDADFYTLISKLQNITVLSLRSTVLPVENDLSYANIRNIPSKIRILDLTECPSAMDQTINSFCQLPFLEELYLAGTAITINGVLIVLKEVRNLKVLDLDRTVVGGETFAVLRQYGQSLVKLYLGQTAVKDFDMMGVDEETFPVLEELCLQRTAVTENGVNKLLFSVHSLKVINLTKSKVKITWMWDQSAYVREKFKYDDHDGNENCNHFLQIPVMSGLPQSDVNQKNENGCV